MHDRCTASSNAMASSTISCTSHETQTAKSLLRWKDSQILRFVPLVSFFFTRKTKKLTTGKSQNLSRLQTVRASEPSESLPRMQDAPGWQKISRKGLEPLTTRCPHGGNSRPNAVMRSTCIRVLAHRERRCTLRRVSCDT